MNSLGRFLHFDFIALLVFDGIAVLVLLDHEFEHAVEMHRHGFVAHDVVAQLVRPPGVFDLLQNPKRPRKHFSKLICFADEQFCADEQFFRKNRAGLRVIGALPGGAPFACLRREVTADGSIHHWDE